MTAMRTAVALLLFALPALAAPVPKSLKKPPANPDGVWRWVEYTGDGQGFCYDWLARDWVIAGEHIFPAVSVEPAHGDKGPPNFTLIDEGHPRLRQWGDRPAVFEVAGDTLRLCVAFDGRKELSECKPDTGVGYYVFERSK
jgi:hypothetical protein